MNEAFWVDPFGESASLHSLLIRLVFDVAFVGVLLFIYHRRHRNRDGVFTGALFNVVTFLLCFVLRRVPIELGFALGLFAVFGVLRYRTEAIRPRELTYYFIVIGLAVLNGVSGGEISIVTLVVVNASVVAIAAALEVLPRRPRGYQLRPGGEQLIVFDNVPLVAPGREAELYADLKMRTGLDVVAHRVERIDLLREVAEITIEQNGTHR